LVISAFGIMKLRGRLQLLILEKVRLALPNEADKPDQLL
jgi:hypothetical protein